MRAAILIHCLLLLASAAAPAQIVWEKTWGGPFDDGAEIRNTRDGGSIAMASYGIHSWIMRLNANGDTLWTRCITQPYDMGAVTETPDGGILATGVTRYANRDLIAWKFDSHGDSLWLRTYPDSTSIEGMYSIFLQPDSSFLITGYTSANSYDMLVLHVDTAGYPIWKKTYGGPGFEGGTMAARTADGGHILTTTIGNSTTYIWVVKIDAAGDTVWTRSYIEPYSTGGSIPMVDNAGKIWVIGWMNHGDYNNYLLCLDSTGNYLWSREYPGIGFESRTARGIIQDLAGGYTFASSVDEAYGPNAGHDIALYRVDSLGQVMRTYRVGGVGDELPRYFEQATNGDYLFIGYSTSFIGAGQQTYIARLNPNGCTELLYDFDTTLYHQVCPGDTLVLDAGASFAHYLWSDGDTNQVRPVLQSDTFHVQATDTNGCLNYSNAVVVEVIPMPGFTWQQVASLTVEFDGTADSGSTVLWSFGDGGTDSLLDPIHIYAAPGAYPVCLTVGTANCPPVTVCDTIVVVMSGVGNWQMNGIVLFPNPAHDQVSLQNRRSEQVDFQLLDATGRTVGQGAVPAQGTVLLDVAALPAGMYLVRTFRAGGAGEVLKLNVLR